MFRTIKSSSRLLSFQATCNPSYQTECVHSSAFSDQTKCFRISIYIYIYIYIYISFETFFYIVRHLDSIASYLPTGLHLGFFHSWLSLYLPSSFSSVVLVLSFVLVSTSMLFWVIFLLLFSERGCTM